MKYYTHSGFFHTDEVTGYAICRLAGVCTTRELTRLSDLNNIPSDGKLIILSEGLPWKEIVHVSCPNALFVISPSNHPGSLWSMVAVPVNPERLKRYIIIA